MSPPFCNKRFAGASPRKSHNRRARFVGGGGGDLTNLREQPRTSSSARVTRAKNVGGDSQRSSTKSGDEDWLKWSHWHHICAHRGQLLSLKCAPQRPSNVLAPRFAWTIQRQIFPFNCTQFDSIGFDSTQIDMRVKIVPQ